MPYLFGGLVIVNAITLGYYLFVQQPSNTQTVEAAKAEIPQPLAFTNSAKHIPPVIGSKD